MSEKTTFQLDFVTPEQVIASKRAEMVVVPGIEGDLGVLPGHAPTIARLRPGMVCTFSGNRVEERVFIEGGIVQIEAEHCIILIEKAEDENVLNKAAIKEKLNHFRNKDISNDRDAQTQINLLETKLALLDNPPYA